MKKKLARYRFTRDYNKNKHKYAQYAEKWRQKKLLTKRQSTENKEFKFTSLEKTMKVIKTNRIMFKIVRVNHH